MRNSIPRHVVAAALILGMCLALPHPLARAQSPSWTAVAPLGTARHLHTATLLPDGNVLVAGGNPVTASCEVYNSQTGTWSATGSLATARREHSAVVLPSGKVLVIGGFPITGSCELYDPQSGTWSATGSLASARSNHTVTLLADGKVLVTGGWSGAVALTSCELYDPSTGTWSAIGSLTTQRALHTATLLSNGKVLVAGGCIPGSAGSQIAACEIYDPTAGTWSGTGALVTARMWQTATLLPDGRVLVAGGATIAGTETASCEIYDPVAGTWSAGGAFVTGRYLHSATLLPNGKVLAAGGGVFAGSTVATASCEIYDPVSNAWSATTSLAAARYYHGATLLPDGKVLTSAGWTTGSIATCELYDPAAGTWTGTGAVANARYVNTATVLPSGKILATGGGSPQIASCEVYDPAAGTWSATGAMATARYDHSASLLSSGKVLVAGGYNSSANGLDSCELYDPVAGTWTATGSLTTPRYSHTATILPSGKVLVVGGQFWGAGPLASCEIYDPATGAWSATGSMATSRAYQSATLLPSGKVLVAGGHNGAVEVTSCELYDPSTGTWSSTGSMATARYYHTATLLPSRLVLVAGGRPTTAACELYNPATGTWAPTGSLVTGRNDHTSTLLPSGNVLITGGTSDGVTPLASCEIYDPAVGSWFATGSLATARDGHVAVLLPSGKAMLVAGWTGSSALASCELYEEAPTQDSWRPTIATVAGSATFPAAVAFGATVTITGTRFKGISEAASGSNSSNNSSNYPLVRLLGLSTGNNDMDSTPALYFAGSATGWANGTSLTVTLPSAAQTPSGYYLLYVIVNGIVGEGKVLLIDTPPVAGTVSDGAGADIDVQSSTTTISANWSGFSDPESGIAGYEWAIGTTPGGTDVQGFTGTGLAGWWRFEETSGTTAHDASGNGNGGSVYGATWSGGSLVLDGTNDYVGIPNPTTLLSLRDTASRAGDRIAEFAQKPEPCTSVRLFGLGVSLLRSYKIVRGTAKPGATGRRRQITRGEQRVCGRPQLTDRDSRIFPPGADAVEAPERDD